MHRLRQLLEQGQSCWLDNLTRRMLRSGELRRRVSDEGIRGVTSNPAIFHKAISSGVEYDPQIKRLSAEGLPIPAIYETLVVSDVRDACDILAPVHTQSDGIDGLVSLEVSPHLAYDTEETLVEARRLWAAVDRPNLLIKVPATREGIAAIHQLLYEGLQINVTLLFSVTNYLEVAEAFVAALERRLSEGRSLQSVTSVASFFISRIDVVVDELLAERLGQARNVKHRSTLTGLFGRAGIAQARQAYKACKTLLADERWRRLASKGARPQRLLWASTGVKNPLYPAALYVEALVGRETVNTMPEETAASFAKTGTVCPDAIEADSEHWEEVLPALESYGIRLDAVTTMLQEEGVTKFVESFDALMTVLAQKRSRFLGRKLNSQRLPERQKGRISATAKALDQQRFVSRLYARDGTLWKREPDLARAIQNRLGWVDSASEFQERVSEIQSFAKEIRNEDFRQIVILGIGSGVAGARVWTKTFGAARGWPELMILDSTDPAAIRQVGAAIETGKTLFIFASRSGATLESLSLYRYHYDLIAKRSQAPGRFFVAITEPGTWLAREAAAKKFRECFLEASNASPRYSAMTYSSLLPAALIGIDAGKIVHRARTLQLGNGPGIPAASSPTAELGAILAMAHKAGRDKVTFVINEGIDALADWLEQLVADTGQEGQGLIPITGEPLGAVRVYGQDRFFVYISHAAGRNRINEKKIDALEKAGHPVVRISMPDRIGLSEELVRWELATATAAAILGVNPFSRPDIAEGKKITDGLLQSFRETGKFPKEKAAASNGGLSVYGDVAKRSPAPEKLVRNFVDSARPGDYVALLPFFRETEARNVICRQIRGVIRDRLKVATTMQYGPGYLHSTAQLHKGGPNKGLFLLFTSDADEEMAIPGQDLGFGTLLHAQALGDCLALRERGRRVIRIHLSSELKSGLRRILDHLR